MGGTAAEINTPPALPGFSVSVLNIPVFRHRLMVMAAFTQRLPVLFVPEQVRVAAMRLDMIHDGCRDKPSFLFASDAPGVTFQKELPGFLPLSPVATQHRVLPFALALLFMFVTIFSPIRHQPWASRILARCLRSSWHKVFFLPLHKPVILRLEEQSDLLVTGVLPQQIPCSSGKGYVDGGSAEGCCRRFWFLRYLHSLCRQERTCLWPECRCCFQQLALELLTGSLFYFSCIKKGPMASSLGPSFFSC